MENKILHLVYIPFTGVGLIGYRGDDWFRERIEIFKKYTARSLIAQTNRNFVLWLSFRPEEENNPIVARLANDLQEMGLPYVMSFNGLMYWDDKFNKNIFSRIANCGRIIRRCWRLGAWSVLVPSLKDLLVDKNSTLASRIGSSLKEFPHHWRKAEWVYLTRIDSDDMFNQNVVELIQTTLPFNGAIVCKKGLIYNTTTGELAEWNPPTNPPFHTIQFYSDVFFSPEIHVRNYGDFKSHEDITRIYEYLVLPSYSYCVTTHNPKNHISTIWNHPFRGKIVNSSVLKDFGVK